MPRAGAEIGLADVLQLRRRACDRRRDPRLFLRGGPVRGADLRRRAGLVERRSARARHRRHQYAELDLHGRSARSRRRCILKLTGIDEIDRARRPRRRQHPRGDLFLPPPAGAIICGVPAAGSCGRSPSGSKWSGSRTCRPSGEPQRHRAQPRLVPRCAAHPFAARRAADLRHRPRHSRSAGGCKPFLRMADARPLDPAQPARDPRADRGGQAGPPARDLPGRTHHRHRLADEDL